MATFASRLRAVLLGAAAVAAVTACIPQPGLGQSHEGAPAPGTVRLAVMDPGITSLPPLQRIEGLAAETIVRELVIAGLAQRTGLTVVRPMQPPTSYMVGTLLSLIGPRARLNVNLIEVSSGTILVNRTSFPPGGADLVTLARAIVQEAIAGLASAGVITADDAMLPSDSPPPTDAPAVRPEALAAWARGLAADLRGEADAARRGYEEALELGGPGFVEAAVALERVGR